VRRGYCLRLTYWLPAITAGALRSCSRLCCSANAFDLLVLWMALSRPLLSASSSLHAPPDLQLWLPLLSLCGGGGGRSRAQLAAKAETQLWILSEGRWIPLSLLAGDPLVVSLSAWPCRPMRARLQRCPPQRQEQQQGWRRQQVQQVQQPAAPRRALHPRPQWQTKMRSTGGASWLLLVCLFGS